MRPNHESSAAVASAAQPVASSTHSQHLELVLPALGPERIPGGRSLAESVMRLDVSRLMTWVRSRWALLLLALSLVGIVAEARSLGFGSLQSAQPGMWPALAAGTGAALLLVVASSEHRALAGNQSASGRQWRAVLEAVPALVGYPLLLASLGFVLPTVIVSVYWLRVVVRQSWRLATVSSALMTAAAYLTFVQLLAVPFPYGPLPVR